MRKVTVTPAEPKPTRSAPPKVKPTTTPPTKTPLQLRAERLSTAKTLQLYRLDANGERNFLAVYDYPLAEGVILESMIQLLHGAGRYRVEYRNARGQIVTTDEPLGIEAIANIHAPANAANQSPPTHGGLPITPQYIELLIKNAMQQAKTPESGFEHFLQTAKILKEVNASTPTQKTLLEQLKELKEVESLLGVNKPEPRAAAVEPDPTTAVLKMLMNDPDQAAQMSSKLGALFTGENPLPEKETNMWDVVKDLGVPILQALAPVLLPMVTNAITAQAVSVAEPMPAMMNQTPPAQPVSHNPPPAQAIPSTSPPAQPTAPTVNSYQRILGRILQAMEIGITPEFIANEIESALQQDETLAPLLDSVLGMPPDQLLQGLASLSPEAKRICELPTALTWLTELQDQFPNEDDADAAPEAISTTQHQAGV